MTPGALTLVLVAGITVPAAAVTLRNLELKAHLDEYPPLVSGGTNYSACWSYVHHDGREYAAIGVGDGGGTGTFEGTAIYNVTNPAGPYRVAFIPGAASIWREMKQYRNWLYVVSEGPGPAEGLQIIRMTNPESPVLAATYKVNFNLAHTVSVDTSRALLVCNGTRVFGGGQAYYQAGMRLLSLANPEAPAELSKWPSFTPALGAQEDTFYVHDSVPVGNRLYASSIYHGIQRVLDITNPASPVQIAAWRYPGGFSHNAWPDQTGNWLYVTDEKNGEPLKIFDISTLSSPQLFNTWTPNSSAIVHNAHVWGDELYLANYTEGIRVLDISDPGHPAEYAWADTYDGPSGGFNGVWDVCAQYPSGTIIASDRNSGLWVFRPRRDYGLVRVRVVDAGSGQPLAGAKVYRGSDLDSLSTTEDGGGVLALDPGSHTLTARLFGYFDASTSRPVAVGSRDTVTLALQPKPKVSFNGVVRNAANQAGLLDAEVILAYGPLHDHTDASGAFALADVPEGYHRVEVRRPGFVPVAFDRQIGPGPASMSFQLVPAPIWNPAESSTGWSLQHPDDTADENWEGKWVHAEPLGTQVPSLLGSAAAIPLAAGIFPAGGARPAHHEGHREAEGLSPGPVQPDHDRTPEGTLCFVTGQGTNPNDVEGYDLDGRTTLTSPTLDATGKTVPTIGYWRWFYTSTGGPDDYLEVLISNDNGSTWVLAEATTGMHDHWEERAIRVADHLAPTSQMKLRFLAVDGGGGSVVEAAVDDLTLYDAAVQPVGAFPEPAPARLALRTPWPNPSGGTVRAILDLPRNTRVEAEVLDLQGRRVAKVFDAVAEAGPVVIAWDGRGADGRTAESGIHFLRARVGRETVTARLVSLR